MKKLKLTCLLGGVMAILAMPAAAQVTPDTYGQMLTNAAAVGIAAGAQSNIVASVPLAIDVPAHGGLAVFVRAKPASTSTAQFGVSFVPSYDGTTYATSQQLWLIGACNATATVDAWTNFAPGLLDNVAKFKVLQITNGAGSQLNVSNIVFSKSN